jgi:hypothetical protein
MDVKFPEKNIKQSILEEIKKTKKRWFFLVGFVFLLNLSFSFNSLFHSGFYFFPWMFLLGYFFIFIGQVRNKFWKNFAKLNDWEYVSKKYPTDEEALMFKQGHGNIISNLIKGKINGRDFRMFKFSFSKGYGKNKRRFNYAGFGFKFNGIFPHFYLNSFENGYNIIGRGVHLSLPVLFEKRFCLYGPKEYEVEGYEIFTPDILEYLLKDSWNYDIELVDQEILFFKYSPNHNINTLEQELEKAVKLVEILAFKLDGMNFEKISNYSSFL